MTTANEMTDDFEAPYSGSGALMDISKGTDLSSFTTSELTKSSAIHGDFDTASLDYSGHQNLEVRQSESFSADARELYQSDPKELLKLAINEGLECMYCGGSSFHEPFATPYSKVAGGATIYYPCSCGETQVVVTDKKWGAESFAAPTGYNESGPRPFYGNPRKMALDRWGNRRYIRRRKDGTYMKNVDMGRSLAMDRRRKSQTWAPSGYRDQGDGSPSLLLRLLDMFKGVDEVVLMAESDLMCADCDDYSSECGCYNSDTDAYIYAYNDGHTDARRNEGFNPSTSDREITSFKKIFKQ